MELEQVSDPHSVLSGLIRSHFPGDPWIYLFKGYFEVYYFFKLIRNNFLLKTIVELL
jgi:hypothetical protein